LTNIEISILLSIHKGEKYLSEQLDSIFTQSYKNFILLIRYDEEHSSSKNIIDNYSSIYQDKIKILIDDLGNIGSTMSFFKLLAHANTKYVMFCDQDDIWDPRKIELSYFKIRLMEKVTPHIPLLVYTDLAVVDEELNIIHDSYWQYQSLNHRNYANWKNIIVQNVVTGCTIIINYSAIKYILPPPRINMIHDQWMAAIVARHGRISYIDSQLVHYRQHSSNVLGANKFSVSYIFDKAKAIFDIIEYARFISKLFHGELSIFEHLGRKLLLNMKRLY
jgi:glycosyltransferase involved in cell wall biosynthesis